MLTTGCPLARPRPAGRATPARAHVRSLLAAPPSSLPHVPGCAPLSCETFRREPATRQFVWSFAPMPMSCQRVEHQHGSGPPPGFPRASASTGIVHCLSGPTAATRRSPPAPALAAFASPPRRAPWSVFQYGSESSAYAPVFSLFHPLDAAFSQFARATCSLSDSPPYLALDASTTRSRCTTKQRYSSLARARGYHPLRPRIPAGSSRAPQRLRLTTGALPCSVAPTGGIHVCFFSCP